MNTRSSRRKNRTTGRSSVFRSPGTSVLRHLMPQSTLGSHSTVSPGASAKGGFGMGIPAGGGGGGGVAAALAGAAAPGLPTLPGFEAPPGIAPPPPFVEPVTDPNLHPFPTNPVAPGPTSPVNTGTYPTFGPTQPVAITSPIIDQLRGKFPTQKPPSFYQFS